MNLEEHLAKEKIKLVETARGSQYHYLSDGRTQRFKKVEGKWYEPQDLIVFIPTRDYLRSHGFDLKIPGNNEAEFIETVKAYLGRKTSRKNIDIVDKNGLRIRHTKSLLDIPSVFALFRTGTDVDFYIPVGKNPRLSFFPLDKNYYFNGNACSHITHLGHEVVKIVLSDGRIIC